MKRLNIKLAVILVAVPVCFLLAAIFLRSWQISRNAGGLVDKADAASRAREYREAVRLRRRYLQYRTNDTPQVSALAKDLGIHGVLTLPGIGGEDIRAAYLAYEEAIRRDPTNRSLRQEMVDLAMQIRQENAAIAHLRELLKDAPAAEAPELTVLLARCLARSGSRLEAIALYNALIGFDEETRTFDSQKATAPGEIEAYTRLAELYVEESFENENADRVMEQLVRANENSYRAHLERGRHLLSRIGGTADGRKQAAAEISRALELAPADPEVLLASADVATAEGDFAQAQTYLDLGVKEHPEDERMYYGLAQLAARMNDAQRAMAYINEGLKKRADSRLLLWMRGTLQLELRDFPGVELTVKDLEKVGYPRPMREYLQARVLFMQGKWTQAAQQFEQLRPLLAEAMQPLVIQLDQYLSQCYEVLQQPDQALEACRRVLAVRATDIDAMGREARCLLSLGKTVEAQERFARLEVFIKGVKAEPTPQFQEMVLDQKIFQQMRLPAEQRKWDEVDAKLADIDAQESFPQSRKIILRANVLTYKGDARAAYELIRGALAEHRDDMSLWLAGVALIARERSPEDALTLIKRMEDEFGDNILLRLNKAELYLRRGGADVKDLLAELEVGIEKFEPGEQAQLRRGLGSVYFRLRDYDEARRLWRLVAEKLPNDLQIRMSLFELAQQVGDSNAMTEALAEVEKVAGKDSEVWKTAEATRLVWRVVNQLESKEALGEARKLLDEARERRPDWYAPAEVYAEIYFQEDDVDSAIKMLQESLEHSNAKPQIVRRLVELLLQRERVEEAQTALKQLDTSLWTSVDLLLQSRILAAQGKFDEALEVTRKVVENSQRPEDHLWHGQLLASAGKLDEAEQVLRKAIDMSPRRSDLRVALIRLLAAKGKLAESEAEIRKAQLKLREDEVPLVLGECYQMLGEFTQARRYYMMALAAHPDDLSVLRRVAGYYIAVGNHVEATKHLDKMLQGAKPNDTYILPDVAWARRAKAQVLSATGNYADYQQAEKLIEANVAEGANMSPQDNLLLVTMAIARPDSISWQEATKRLQQIQAQERKLTVPESLVLAQLYDRSGRYNEAEEIMGSLLASDPRNPSIVAPYVRMLLRTDKSALAETWLKNLDPTLPAARRLQAHMLVQQGKVDEGIALVRSLLPQPLAPEQYDALRAAGELLEEMAAFDKSGRVIDEAEKYFRDYVQKRPEQILTLAVFLGKRGKVDEAFEICEQQWQAGAPKGVRDQPFRFSILQIGIVALQQHRGEVTPDSPHYAQVRNWIHSTTRSYADSKVLVLYTAFLEDLEGNVSKVVGLYRDFLARNDTTPREKAVVRNNLAFLLAMQGEHEESGRLIEEAIQEMGPTSDLLDTRALVYLARGEARKAILDLENSLADNEQPNKYFHLALAQLQDRNRVAAEEAMHKANEKGLKVKALTRLELEKYQQLVQTLGIAADL